MKKPKKGLAILTASALVMSMLAVPVTYSAAYSNTSNTSISSPSSRLVNDGKAPLNDPNLRTVVDGKQKTEYLVGEEFDYWPGSVEVSMAGVDFPLGSLPINDPAVQVYGFDTSTPGRKTVSVAGTMQGMTGVAKYTINVSANPNPVIAQLDGSQRLNYQLGDQIDTSTGNIVLTTQATGQKETIALNDERVVSVTPRTNAEIGVQRVDVVINYNGTTVNTYYSAIFRDGASATLSLPNPDDPNEVDYMPQLVYEYGEPFNADPQNGCGYLILEYKTGSLGRRFMTMDAFTIEGFDSTKPGKQTITASVLMDDTGEVISTTYEITIGENPNAPSEPEEPTNPEEPEDKEILALDVLDYKETYTLGEAFDYNTGQIAIEYSDDSPTEYIKLTDSRLRFEGYDPNKVGEQEIKVYFEGYDEPWEFYVTVIADVSSIALDGSQKVDYTYQEELDLTRGQIIATLSNNETLKINLDNPEVTITGYDSQKTGQQTLTVTYKGKTVNYTVNVVAPATDFRLDGTQRTDYKVGDLIDKSVGNIIVTYADGSEKTFPFSDEDNVSIMGFDTSKVGTSNVTVRFETLNPKYYTINVAAAEVTVTSIALDGKQKTDYKVGDELDRSVGNIIVTFSDNTTQTIPLSDGEVKIDGFSSTTTGEKTLTVTYKGAKVEFDVAVDEAEATIINYELDGKQKTVYQKGQELDLSLGNVIITYSDGDQDYIPLDDDDVTVTGYNKNQLGVQTLFVNYNLNGEAVPVGGYGITVVENLKEIETIYLDNTQKTSYYVGDTLSRDTGNLVVKYVDGTTEQVPFNSDKITVTGFNSNAVGTSTVTVAYEGKTTTYDVEIAEKPEVILTSIEIKNPQTAYYVGEDIDRSVGSLVLTYSDDTTREIPLTDVGITFEYDKNTIGSQQVTVSYQDIRDVFTINISAQPQASIVSIGMDGTEKKEYELNEAFDINAGKLVVIYDDQTTETLPLTTEGIEISTLDSSTPGEKTITVAYKEKTTSFKVTVKEAPAPTLTSIKLNGEQKVVYELNEDFDYSKGKLILTYSDNSTEEIALNAPGVTVTGFNGIASSDQVITVNYGGLTTSYTITVTPAPSITISSIEMDGNQKTVYDLNEGMNVTAGKIIVNYSDGSSSQINLNDPAVYITGFNSTIPGEQTLTVSYQGKTTTYKITVNNAPVEPTITSIKLKGDQKSQYNIGDKIDLTTGTLIATYSDNSTKEIALNSTDVTVSELDSTAAGTKTITVTYNGLITQYEVEVIDNVVTVTEITMNNNQKTTYEVGEDLDLTIGSFKATFSNGDTETIALNAEGVSVTGYDKTKAGTQEITVTYKNATTKYVVTVKEATISLTGIKMDGKQQAEYTIGETLNLASGSLILEYSDGTVGSLALNAEGVSVTPLDSSTAGEKTITVSYKDKTTTFVVTVKSAEVTLDSISMDGTQKTTYVAGESLNRNMGNIILNYSDGTNETLPLSSGSVTVTGFQVGKLGTQVLTVTYNGKSTAYLVTVNVNCASEVYDISGTGIKYMYSKGEEFSTKTGGIWVYSQRISNLGKYINSKTYVPLNNPLVNITGFNSSVSGLQEITIEYKGVTTTEYIIVM